MRSRGLPRGGPYRIPNVDVEAKAVYTNNPNSGAMRGFGSNQAQFAMEGIMDMLAEKVGIDGYDIRERNVLLPGDQFATGQIMRPSVGILQTLQAVKDTYKSAKYAGIGCGIKSTGLGNGVHDDGAVKISVLPGGRSRPTPVTPKWARGCSPLFVKRSWKRPESPPKMLTSAGRRN